MSSYKYLFEIFTKIIQLKSYVFLLFYLKWALYEIVPKTWAVAYLQGGGAIGVLEFGYKSEHKLIKP